MVHGIVSSMFSGHLGANNNSGFQAAKQTAQATMGGLVGGAMGAYSQIKNASSPSANTSQSSQSTSGNSNKDNDSSSKDRNGFDTSLINDDSSSMSGEIKPS